MCVCKTQWAVFLFTITCNIILESLFSKPTKCPSEKYLMWVIVYLHTEQLTFKLYSMFNVHLWCFQKYYPPDFDPSKIPRMKLAKNRQYTVRLMAPFNMRCATCGEYIYKGKKFNARKEDVENEDYLGIRIYRFYIKVSICFSIEIP